MVEYQPSNLTDPIVADGYLLGFVQSSDLLREEDVTILSVRCTFPTIEQIFFSKLALLLTMISIEVEFCY